MKLITEQTWDTQNEILEESGQKSFYLISNNAIQVDLQNKNKRIYPGQTMGKQISRYLNEDIKQGTAYGELGHPQNASINEERISHRFIDIKQVDKNYYSIKAKIIDEGLGKIARSCIEGGGKLGISTRAVGSVQEKNGIQIVQEDLHLVTAGDIVVNPSAQKAFVQGIYEGVEYDFVDGVLMERVIDLKDQYKITMSSEQKTNHLIKVFDIIVNSMVKNG